MLKLKLRTECPFHRFQWVLRFMQSKLHRAGALRWFDQLAQKLLSGEGLVGQAARSRQLLHVRDVPASHLPVSSGTGQSDPVELLVAPAMENGQVFAVIELGFCRPLGDTGRGLRERASEKAAGANRSGLGRSRLQALLGETPPP